MRSGVLPAVVELVPSCCFIMLLFCAGAVGVLCVLQSCCQLMQCNMFQVTGDGFCTA